LLGLTAGAALAQGAVAPQGLTLDWGACTLVGFLNLHLGLELFREGVDLRKRAGWLTLGGFIAVVLELWAGRSFEAAVLTANAFSLLLLSVATMNRSALGAGTLVAAAVFAVSGLQLGALIVGHDVLGFYRLNLDGNLGSEASTVLRGDRAPYQLALPAGRWFDYHPSAGTRVPGFDRWVIDPDDTAQVRVIAHHLPGASGFDPDGFQARIKRYHPNAEWLESLDLTSPFDAARLLHLRERRGGVHLEGYVGLFTRADEAFEVSAIVPQARFAELGEAFRQSVLSFSFEPPGKPTLSASVLETVKRATALVRTPSSAGSGFIAARANGQAFILTNAHVLVDDDGQAPKRTDVAFPGFDLPSRSATLLALDVRTDLALLAVSDSGLGEVEPLPLREVSKVPEGTPAFVVGFPLAHSAYLNVPTINAGHTFALDAENEVLPLAVGINPGNSGGPVVASDGSVLGIVQAKIIDSETSFAIPSSVLGKFAGTKTSVRWERTPLPTAPSSTITATGTEVSPALPALVQISAESHLSAGVIVDAPFEGLLVLARADQVGDEAEPMVTLNVGTASARTVAARVLRSDAENNLALLALGRVAPAPLPVELGTMATLPETSPLSVLGLKVREGLFGPLVPVHSLRRDGVLARRPLASGPAVVDVGVNPDFEAGPVVDQRGVLLGFAVATGPETNLTSVASAETIARFLEGRVSGGAARWLSDGLGSCTLEVEVDLDDPRHDINNVGLALLPGVVDGPYGPLPDELPATVMASTSTAHPAGQNHVVLSANTHSCSSEHLGFRIWTESAKGTHWSPSRSLPTAVTSDRVHKLSFNQGSPSPEVIAFLATPFKPVPGWSVAGDPLQPQQVSRACARGNAPACSLWARLEETSNPEESASADQMACEAGVGGSCLAMARKALKDGMDEDEYGRMVPNEDDAENDEASDKALELASRACSLNWAEGCRQAATILESDGDHEGAAGFLDRGCALRNAESCAELGLLTLAGSGVTASVPRGRALLSKACRASDSGACVQLGDSLASEVAVGQMEAAFALYSYACEQGHAEGCFDQGQLLELGSGTHRSWREAKRAFARACVLNGGSAKACESVTVAMP
jgi:S1-C subfamily serine protease/TPR repeat protein